MIIPGGDDDAEEVPTQPLQETHPEQQTPERPWTPSYAVTTQQGSSPKASDSTLPTSTADAVTEKSEPERPASRGSWTPSYTVSRQGSVSSLKEQEPAPAAAPEEPAAAVAEPQVEIAAPAPVRPASRNSFTPSYSVSRQGSRSSLKEAATPAQQDDTTAQAEPETAASAPQRPLSRSSFPAAYSVSRQGSRSSLKPEDATESPVPAQSQSPVITGAAALVEEPVSEEPEAIKAPERPWTPSYSVERQGSSPLQSPEAQPVETQPAAPERPWTPSYSVARQGSSPLLNNAELAPAQVAAPEPTETVEKPAINVEEVAPVEAKTEETGTQDKESVATEVRITPCPLLGILAYADDTLLAHQVRTTRTSVDALVCCHHSRTRLTCPASHRGGCERSIPYNGSARARAEGIGKVSVQALFPGSSVAD